MRLAPDGTCGVSAPHASDEHRERKLASSRDLWKYLVLLFAIALFFFLSSSRAVLVFDDGIQLTSAMRVMAGQVVHRDFYYNYGPAELYILAGLFKLFGPSVFVARLWRAFEAGWGAVLPYILARRLSTRTVAAGVLVLSLFWLGSLGLMTSFSVWSTYLLLPLLRRGLPASKAVLAGAMVGLTALFRYDTAVGLIGTHVVVMALAVCLRREEWAPKVRSAAVALGWYLLGFALLFIPPAIAYLAVAPAHAMLHDVFIYNAKYYRLGRGLPFPRIHRANFADIIVYAFPVFICLGLYAGGRWWAGQRRPATARTPMPTWIFSLVAFSLLAAVMYSKGLVRTGAGPLYMTVAPCALIAAVLCARLKEFAIAVRVGVVLLVVLFLMGGLSALWQQIRLGHSQRTSTLRWIVSPSTQTPRPPFDRWCREKNPITRGFCYVLDDDHIQTVEFIEQHTRPGDTLYVGLPHHDRIWVADNITYFATQRLPATKWTQFEPLLQTRADIQREMKSELERSKPPYIVLDSEFDNSSEPNGSSLHSGVFLLDDYISSHYVFVQRFGEMTILERL